LNIAYH